MIIRRSRAALLAATALSLPLSFSPVLVAPASAQWIVYDPTNYAQNVLQAARALEQINNQITSLQNEAQMLINQARNLASLPHSSLQRRQQSIQRTQQLLGQAHNIAFDVQQIDQAFQTTYGNASLSASDQQLIADARTRWQNTVGGLQDAMRVQATVVGNLDTNRTEMSALVGQSQGATGALQAMQAGNQILALQAQQLADLTAVVAADGRARALADAERAAAAEQGREQRRRFLTPGLSARQRQHVPGQRQLTGALMDSKTLARIGAIAFIAVAITATVIELSRKEERPETAPSRLAHAGVADPLRDELFRCQSLGEAGPRDTACLRAWAKSRRRFLTPGTTRPQAGSGSPSSSGESRSCGAPGGE